MIQIIFREHVHKLSELRASSKNQAVCLGFPVVLQPKARRSHELESSTYDQAVTFSDALSTPPLTSASGDVGERLHHLGD